MYRVIQPPLHTDFHLPGRDELLSLDPGSLIKIIFQVNSETPERLWVKLLQKDGDSEWKGEIDSDPIGAETSKELKAGTLVKFHPLNIVQIWY